MAKVKKFVKVGRPVTAVRYFDLDTASRFGRGGRLKFEQPKSLVAERAIWTIVACAAITAVVLFIRG